MTDESKLRDQVDRGERARSCLKELQEAFKALEDDCFDTFRRSDVHDDQGRLACRLYLKVMDDVKARFVSAVNTGEAARKELIRLKDPTKLKRLMRV